MRTTGYYRDYNNADAYVIYYECTDDAPVLGNYNNFLQPQGRRFIKIRNGAMALIALQPDWYPNGPLPDNKYFSLINTNHQVNKFVSSEFIPHYSQNFHGLNEHGYNDYIMGLDHCNQNSPQPVYEFVPVQPPGAQGQQEGGKRRKIHKTKSFRKNKRTKKFGKNKRTKKFHRKHTKKHYNKKNKHSKSKRK
jgi:hypothetical protein